MFQFVNVMTGKRTQSFTCAVHCRDRLVDIVNIIIFIIIIIITIAIIFLIIEIRITITPQIITNLKVHGHGDFHVAPKGPQHLLGTLTRYCRCRGVVVGGIGG